MLGQPEAHLDQNAKSLKFFLSHAPHTFRATSELEVSGGSYLRFEIALKHHALVFVVVVVIILGLRGIGFG